MRLLHASHRLLRELPDFPAPRLRCVAYATPAIGNSALADFVEEAGWAGYFSSYFLPGGRQAGTWPGYVQLLQGQPYLAC